MTAYSYLCKVLATGSLHLCPVWCIQPGIGCYHERQACLYPCSSNTPPAMQIAPRPVHAARRRVRDLQQVPHYLRELIIEVLTLLEDKGNQASDSLINVLSAAEHWQSGQQCLCLTVLTNASAAIRNHQPL